MKSAARLTRMLSISSISLPLLAASCDPPVTVPGNTLCASTSRYHTTADQKAVYAADGISIRGDDGRTRDAGSGEQVFGSLVRWLLAFNKLRDAECLKPSIGN